MSQYSGYQCQFCLQPRLVQLHGCTKLCCSILMQPRSHSNSSLGRFPILVASDPLRYQQHLSSVAVPGAGKGFFGPCFMGENCSRGMKRLAEGHRGKVGVCQHTRNCNHKTFRVTLITLLRNRTKTQKPGIIHQYGCHPHHYSFEDGIKISRAN